MYKSKVRVCLSLYSKAAFDGKTPSLYISNTDEAATLNVIDERMWKQATQDLWIVLFLPISSSANNIFKKSEGKRPEDGAEDGQTTWKTLNGKYNSHTQEARRVSTRSSSTPEWSPARIPKTYLLYWTNDANFLKTSGTRTIL